MRFYLLLLSTMAIMPGFASGDTPPKSDKPAPEKPVERKPAGFVPMVALVAKGDTRERPEQLRSIQSDYQHACETFVEELSAARTPEEQKAVLAMKPQLSVYNFRCRRLVEANPKDETALLTLGWMLRFGDTVREPGPMLALRRPGQAEPPAFKPLDVLLEHHLNNPKLATICETLDARVPGSEAFLEAVLAKSTVATTRGVACLRLGEMLQGKSAGKVVDASKREQLWSRAEQYYEQAIRDFGEVKLGQETIKDVAGDKLYYMRNLSVGRPLPELVSEDLRGNKVQLSDYRGKVVVVDVWATWCGPCCAMIPEEREMVKKLENKPFALVSVNFDTKKETLEKFLEKQPMPWTHWFNGRNGPIKDKLRITGYPTIFVLDAKGVIRFKDVRGKELEEAVESLLREGASEKTTATP